MFISKNTKYILKILTLLFFLFFSINSNAQENLDSLVQKLDENIDNKDYISQNFEIINKIYNQSYLSQPSQAIEIAGMAMSLAKTQSDSLEITALWYTKIGNVHLASQNYSFAMSNYREAYEIYNKLKDKKNIAYSFINIGNTFVSQMDYAYKYYKRADSLLTEIEDTFGLITVKYRIGYIKYLNYETDTAFYILHNAKNLSEKIENSELIAFTNFYLAKVYAENQDKDSAIFYYNAALKNFEKYSEQFYIGKIYYSLGKIYFEDDDYQNSEKYFNLSYEIFNKLSINSWLATINNDFSKLYFENNNIDKAESFALLTLKMSEENNEGFEIQMRDAYFMLSEVYKTKKNINKAYEYLILYTEINNQIHETEIINRQSELQASLETENTEKEIEMLKKEDVLKERELKIKQGIFIIVLFFFILLAAYYFYTSKKQKKSYLILTAKNDEIVSQKREIESQSKILEKANRAIMKQKDEIEKKTIKITHSINYASRIQQAMLSNIYVLKEHFDDHYVLFKPKEAVSGDFYWFSVVKDEHAPSLFKKKATKDDVFKIVVAVVDCTGHGVPGAFMSMLGDAYLNQIVNIQKITESDIILSELHKAIRATLQQRENDNNDGMDVALCVIDKNKKELHFSGAKNPLIYIQNGEINRINGDLMSIGGLQKERVRHFQKYVVDVSIPTCCYIYSDGFQDQFGGKYGRKFMAKPFRDLIEDNYSKPFEEQHKILLQSLKKWQGKYPQMDDITVVGFKI